jgi:hypothetical protein
LSAKGARYFWERGERRRRHAARHRQTHRVLVCPATCQRLKDGGNLKIEVRYGCATRID